MYARFSPRTPLAKSSPLSAPILSRSSSSSSRTTSTPPPTTLSGSLDNTPLSLTSTPTPASSTMYRNRSFGYSTSNGTYAPPAFNIPRIPTTISTDRSIAIPTNTSGPTPFRCRYLPNWFALRFNSPYVIPSPSHTTAIRSACRLASRATSSCTHRSRSPYSFASPQLLASTSNRSPSLINGSREISSSACSTIPSSTTANCRSTRSIASSANRLRSYVNRKLAPSPTIAIRFSG